MSMGTTTVFNRAFAGLEKETLNALRQVAERRDYPAGVTLCHQGVVEHTFYVVMQGRVAVVQQMADGQERLLGAVGPGEYFGEMGLIDDSPRSANCVTVMPTTVLEVTEEIFDRFVEQSPAVAHSVLRRILQTARANDQRHIEELQQKNEELQQAYADLKAAQARLIEKERLMRELEVAADMQRTLLPDELPQYPDYQFAAHLQPASQVGGDFYDVIHLDDEHVGILIADVSDKGIHAALFMAVSRTLFAQEARQSLSPAEVALAVHQGILQVAATADMFVTAFYGVLHRPSGCLTYVRAAQDRPLLYRPGKPVQSLAGNGRFLGMLPELTLPEHTIQLYPADRLVMFSDGVPDAVNPQEVRYGGERLSDLLAAGGHLSADELVNCIAEDVTTWCDGAPPFDDLTLLVMEVR